MGRHTRVEAYFDASIRAVGGALAVLCQWEEESGTSPYLCHLARLPVVTKVFPVCAGVRGVAREGLGGEGVRGRKKGVEREGFVWRKEKQ